VATVALLAAASTACGSPSGPSLPDAEIRILFVGNSLTYENDLPGLVATVADVGGLDVATATRARANYSLEDHWHDGLEAVIRDLDPDFVIMQQGPSSLLQSQIHLKTWARIISEVAHEVGATPALLMVWPPADRFSVFDAVHESYRQAAQAADALFIPAGSAWLEVWAEDPDAELYGPDDLHPSRLGSVVAALTVAQVALGVDPAGLPATLVPARSGLPTITLAPAEAELLQRAVARAVAAAGG
jgi:lysophospholipase L1-like esterase